MPVYATFHNTIFDIRCSKCKRTQENHYFQSNGRVFKTCNECRDRAARRRMCPEFLAVLARSNQPIPPSDITITRRIPDADTSDDDSVHYPYPNYIDTDMAAVLLLSSSAAAAPSSSSAGYFVDEPDPEPEPEGP